MGILNICLGNFEVQPELRSSELKQEEEMFKKEVESVRNFSKFLKGLLGVDR